MYSHSHKSYLPDQCLHLEVKYAENSEEVFWLHFFWMHCSQLLHGIALCSQNMYNAYFIEYHYILSPFKTSCDCFISHLSMSVTNHIRRLSSTTSKAFFFVAT